MPWSITVPMLVDESISSWLTRAALAQGCDPLCLTGAVWPKWRVWTLDIDRGIPPERLSAIVSASGLSENEFEMADVRRDIERIAGRALSDTQRWSWLLALGSRNRQRYGGQQYCPECLSSDPIPYFRREWRFAWWIACPKHGALLVDRCPVCRAPITPHQLLATDQKISICARCKADLRDAPRHPVDAAAMRFQIEADTVLRQGFGTFDGVALAAHEWFSIGMLMVKLARLAARSEAGNLSKAIRSLRVVPAMGIAPESSLMFETLSAVERLWLLQAVAELLSLTIDEWRRLFERFGVRPSALRRLWRDIPPQFARLLDTLPAAAPIERRRGSRPDRPKPRSRRAVESAWIRLQRKARVWATSP